MAITEERAREVLRGFLQSGTAAHIRLSGEPGAHPDSAFKVRLDQALAAMLAFATEAAQPSGTAQSAQAGDAISRNALVEQLRAMTWREDRSPSDLLDFLIAAISNDRLVPALAAPISNPEHPHAG